MKGHSEQCVERCGEVAKQSVAHLQRLAAPCMDEHRFGKHDCDIVGELANVCAQIVLTCLKIVRIGRPNFLWIVNIPARAVTKWKTRLARLISRVAVSFAGALSGSKGRR